MLSTIKEFADNSETLNEARNNVKEMSFIKEIGIYIGLFILMYVLFTISQNIFMLINPFKDFSFFPTLGFIIIPVTIYWYITKIEKRSMRSIGFSKDNAVSSTLKGLLIGFLMMLSVVIIGMLLGQFSFNGFDFSAIIYLIPCFLIFTLQCFSEEMYTRGWTMTYFYKRHSLFLAIIINCIIFIIPHLINPGIDLLAIINIFIVAIFFAVLFLRFDNIWVCGGAHTAWNFSQGLIFGFNVSGLTTPTLMKCSQVGHNIINGGTFGPESSLIATVVIIISLILAVYYPKK